MPQKTASRPRLLLTVMCVGYFVILLDVTIVSVALPHIRTDLRADVTGLQWVVDGYAVSLASLLLPGGVLGDVRGHRPVVLTGLATFGLASLVCGLAPNTAILIAGRAAQGIGAAMLLPGTLAIIARAYPERRDQARAIGLWAAIGSLALPAGPLLGGLLVESVGWRGVFWLNVPIVAVAYAAVAWLTKAVPPSRARRLDRVGGVLACATLAFLTYTLTRLGNDGFDIISATASVVALVLIGVFVVVERRHPDPVLPLSLLRCRTFAAANGIAMVMNLGTLGLLFVLTFFLQTVQQRSALEAGVALFPLFLPLVLLAPISGRLAARFGPRLPMAGGLLLATAGVLAFVDSGAAAPYASLLPAMLAWGVGLALLTPAVVASAVAAVPPARAGLASGVNNTCRQAGGAIGIAAYGSIAGPPASARFVAGFHVTAAVTAVLFLAAAVVALLASACGAGGRPSRGASRIRPRS